MNEHVGAWFVTKEAKELFARLVARWELLEKWGVRTKLPGYRLTFEAWDDFRRKWLDGDEEVEKLNPTEAELNMVELAAEGKGFVRPGARPGGVDLEQMTEPLKAAAAVDREVKAVKAEVQEIAAAAPAGLASLAAGAFGRLPLAAKVAVPVVGAGLLWLKLGRGRP
ncbi:uncharacterized protein SOCE26_052770 [Sorangium cellulosum]|uniref:Uncharacterized protein n=1 Tax=Sorangium cellulosum TaxID=56 RepID=A0A2L0EWZ0_SORCE|nr:hypothetical protein [Sorangium cellulosum]AUX43822.1 uncharacterized protein SOCE26_052770 [Sorangium cellulosum]